MAETTLECLNGNIARILLVCSHKKYFFFLDIRVKAVVYKKNRNKKHICAAKGVQHKILDELVNVEVCKATALSFVTLLQ